MRETELQSFDIVAKTKADASERISQKMTITYHAVKVGRLYESQKSYGGGAYLPVFTPKYQNVSEIRGMFEDEAGNRYAVNCSANYDTEWKISCRVWKD